jgi:hypothetical protein
MTAALIKYDAARCALAEAHIAEIFVIRNALMRDAQGGPSGPLAALDAIAERKP